MFQVDSTETFIVQGGLINTQPTVDETPFKFPLSGSSISPLVWQKWPVTVTVLFFGPVTYIQTTLLAQVRSTTTTTTTELLFSLWRSAQQLEYIQF